MIFFASSQMRFRFDNQTCFTVLLGQSSQLLITRFALFLSIIILFCFHKTKLGHQNFLFTCVKSYCSADYSPKLLYNRFNFFPSRSRFVHHNFSLHSVKHRTDDRSTGYFTESFSLTYFQISFFNLTYSDLHRFFRQTGL